MESGKQREELQVSQKIKARMEDASPPSHQLPIDPLISQTHGQSLLGSDQALQWRICVTAGLGELSKFFKGPQSKGKLAESEANQKNLSRGTWSVEFKEASHGRKSWVFSNCGFPVL